MQDATPRGPSSLSFLLLLEPSLALVAIALGVRAAAEPSAGAVSLLVGSVVLALAPLLLLARRVPVAPGDAAVTHAD